MQGPGSVDEMKSCRADVARAGERPELSPVCTSAVCIAARCACRYSHPAAVLRSQEEDMLLRFGLRCPLSRCCRRLPSRGFFRNLKAVPGILSNHKRERARGQHWPEPLSSAALHGAHNWAGPTAAPRLHDQAQATRFTLHCALPASSQVPSRAFQKAAPSNC